MHIPDGFLSPAVLASGWLFSLAVLKFALGATQKLLKEKMVPLMGVMAAFIFAAQMLNFPVLVGVSGHLLGGILAAVVLGPMPATIIISLVLVVQCLIFQDGGVIALGANIFNMAIMGTIAGYYFYLLLKQTIFKKHFLGAVFVSAWFSVILAAFLCATELAFSGTVRLKIVLPAMLFLHVFIGFGEAIITTFVIRFILQVRPDLVYGEGRSR